MEVDSAINFMIYNIKLRRPWLSPFQIRSAERKLHEILEANQETKMKINMKRGCRKGSIGKEVKQALHECGIHRAFSKEFCMWIKPGEVFFQVEKHGNKFTVFKTGEREWRRGDPIYVRRNGCFSCFL